LPSADAPGAVRWKDVVYDETHNLSLRMCVPPAGAGKVPVLVYFHGVGFCVGSFAEPNFHAACLRLAASLPAVVLSADYRLAPEHSLPAAFDDAGSVFSWLRAQAAAGTDPWLASSADLGRLFVSGDSPGANIAHHAAVRAGPGGGVRLAGCVLLWPYFGGERRTASEAACPADVFLTLPRVASRASEGDTCAGALARMLESSPLAVEWRPQRRHRRMKLLCKDLTYGRLKVGVGAVIDPSPANQG